MPKTIISILTLAGLIPFAWLPIFFITGFTISHAFYPLYANYGFGIICFLCGTFWPINLPTKSPAKGGMLAVYSNVLVLLAWVGHSYLSFRIELLLQAALIFLLWLIDMWLYSCDFRDAWYFRLRSGVTILVIVCLLSTFYRLSF